MAVKNPITLYIVPNCPLCSAARGWLERHGIAYVERDIVKDFGALRSMFELTRQRFVPVFEVNGTTLVRPSDEVLEKLLL